MDIPAPLGLPPALTAAPDVRAVFSAAATVQAALDVEAALARACVSAGLCSAAQAAAIGAAAQVGRYDLAAMAEAAARAGTLAIPLAKALTAEVAKGDPAAAGAVHLGATSQDIGDSGFALQVRAAMALLRPEAEALRAALAGLARDHRDSVLAGRTLLQPGPPVTLGLKAAGWLGGLDRGWQRLEASTRDALVLQFGGAVGTLASLGAAGPAVAAALARELDLTLPAAPWHTQRDRIAHFACDAAVVVGSLAKMARDVTLLMQAEVAEVAEPGGNGRGGSSAMPHKRNPMASTVALAAAHRVPGLISGILAGMAQEHERATGGWQAESQAVAEVLLALSACLRAMREVAEGLRVDTARMRANWDALDGLPLAERLTAALAPTLGRGKAHALCEKLCVEAIQAGRTLREVAGEAPAIAAALTPEELDAIFDPAGYLGAAGAFCDALLAAHSGTRLAR